MLLAIFPSSDTDCPIPAHRSGARGVVSHIDTAHERSPDLLADVPNRCKSVPAKVDLVFPSGLLQHDPAGRHCRHCEHVLADRRELSFRRLSRAWQCRFVCRSRLAVRDDLRNRQSVSRGIQIAEFLFIQTASATLHSTLEHDIHLPVGCGVPGADYCSLFARLAHHLLRINGLRSARGALPVRSDFPTGQSGWNTFRAKNISVRHRQGYRRFRHSLPA